MQITIRRDDLARAVKAAGKVVESRNTIPILGSLLLSAANGAMTVTATDLDIVATTSTPCGVAKPGKICVDAKLLSDIASKAGAAEMLLSVTDGRLEIKSGRSKFNLGIFDPVDFPTLDGGVFDAEFELDIATMFAPVGFAISSEDTRYQLNGVFFKGGHSSVAVATDGHRLARHFGPELPDFIGIIVPKKLCGMLPKGMVRVSVSSSKIRIASSDMTITSKLIDGTFPDYERVIPQANELSVVVDRDEMTMATERVVTISSEKSRAVRLSVAPGAVALSANSDIGNAVDEVAADYSGAPFEIGFNSAYLRDAFAVLLPGKVTMRMQAGCPALITGGNEGLDLVLMPVRI